MNNKRFPYWPVLVPLCLILLSSPILAQEYGARLGTVKSGGVLSFEPQGPGVMFGALDPAKRRWYGTLQRVPLAAMGVFQLRPGALRALCQRSQ